MRLEGARVLVVGGAQRLGRSIVLGLAEAGADVAFSYRSHPEQAQRTAAEVRALGRSCIAVRADVTQVAQARSLVDEAAAALGGLDVLVYAVSGGFAARPPEEVDEALFDAAVDSTLKGGFFCAQAAYRAMDGEGVMVVLTDVAAFEPWPLFAAHAAAKAGLAHLVKTLARAWAPGVRVCGVAPGTVMMPDGASPDSIRRSEQAAALGRIGSPADVVDAVLFLIQSDYVTGSQLIVDGGRLLL